MTNATTTNRMRLPRSIAPVFAVAFLAGTCAAAVQDAGSPIDLTAHQYVYTMDDGGTPAKLLLARQFQQDDQERTVHLESIDGKIRVKVDGKEIDADQIKASNGRFVILDDKGGEVDVIAVPWIAGQPELNLTATPFGMDAPRVVIGIHMEQVGEPLAHHLDVDASEAVIVTAIIDGLPAAESGIEVHDVIVQVDGKKPVTTASLRELIGDRDPGDEVELTLIHKGDRRKVNVPLAAYDAELMGQGTVTWSGRLPVTGEFVSGEAELLYVPGADETGTIYRQYIDATREAHPSLRVRPRIASPRGQVGETSMEDRLRGLQQRVQEIQAALEQLIEQSGGE